MCHQAQHDNMQKPVRLPKDLYQENKKESETRVGDPPGCRFKWHMDSSFTVVLSNCFRAESATYCSKQCILELKQYIAARVRWSTKFGRATLMSSLVTCPIPSSLAIPAGNPQRCFQARSYFQDKSYSVKQTGTSFAMNTCL